MNEERLIEILDYIKVSKNRCNTRLEIKSISKLLKIFNIDYDEYISPFENIFFNYDNFFNIIPNQINDLFRFYSTHGEERGIELIKNNLKKKQKEEIIKIEDLEKSKIESFCKYLKDKGCIIKFINSCIVIKKDNYVFKESEDIVNYISPVEYYNYKFKRCKT